MPKIDSVWVVDPHTGNQTSMRFSPHVAIRMVISGLIKPTSQEPDCDTVMFCDTTPEEKRQIAKTFFGCDPLASARKMEFVGSLLDYVVECDLDSRYGMPVLSTVGYNRSS